METNSAVPPPPSPAPPAPAAVPAATAPVAPPPAPELPPAARIVVEGSKTERESELEAELETERSARRKAETDASYAQDEARRLKEVQSREPRPRPAKKSGWTFFDED
jgi:hypothetical protein